ncbi:MAG TPA: hypothetical protein OIM28_02040 [Clostridiaceae bacterium]|nr:hypothetical protein [Clostridiaceae bacterium]
MNLNYYKQLRMNFLKKLEKDYYIYLNNNNLINKDLETHANAALQMYTKLIKSNNNISIINQIIIKQIICKK